jgi:hypothetical protein
MNNSKLLSIVITTTGKHNANLAHLINSTESVFLQPYEVIVVNDSNVKLPKLESLHAREVSSSEGTPFGSLIVGVKVANGKYIVQQNDDDPPTFERLSVQLDSIVGTNFTYSVCPVVKVNKFGFKIPTLLQGINYDYYKTLLLLLGSFGSDATLLFEKEPFLKSSLGAFKGFAMADWAWGLENMSNFNTKAVSSVKYRYLQHTQQITRTARYSKFEAFKEIYYIWAERNSREHLPKLSIEEAFLVSIGSASRIKVESLQNVLEWLESFQEVWLGNSDCSAFEVNMLDKLLTRKKMLIFWGQKSWAKLLGCLLVHPNIALSLFRDMVILLINKSVRR